MVLNHQMIGSLRRGDIREGVLLGVGRVSIPETYRGGEEVAITLIVRDQWDCEPSATFNLQLTRCRTRANGVAQSNRGPSFPTPITPLPVTP